MSCNLQIGSPDCLHLSYPVDIHASVYMTVHKHLKAKLSIIFVLYNANIFFKKNLLEKYIYIFEAISLFIAMVFIVLFCL